MKLHRETFRDIIFYNSVLMNFFSTFVDEAISMTCFRGKYFQNQYLTLLLSNSFSYWRNVKVYSRTKVLACKIGGSKYKYNSIQRREFFILLQSSHLSII